MRKPGVAFLLGFLILTGCTTSHLERGRAYFRDAGEASDAQKSILYYTAGAEELVEALRTERLVMEEDLEARSALIRCLIEIGLEPDAEQEIRVTAKTYRDHTYRKSTADPGVLHLVAAERYRLLAALAMEEDARMELLDNAVTEAYLAQDRFDSPQARKHVDLIKVRLLRLKATATLALLEPDRLSLTRKASDTLERALFLCSKYRDRDFRKERRRIQGTLFALKTYP